MSLRCVLIDEGDCELQRIIAGRPNIRRKSERGNVDHVCDSNRSSQLLRPNFKGRFSFATQSFCAAGELIY
jgi:hypothetical protein